MHQNTFNQACITDASVQKVFKARGQVRLPNTAVTAKLSAPGNPRCVARGDVLGHIPGGGEKDDIMKRGAFSFGAKKYSASPHGHGFEPFHKCLL